MNCWVRWGPRMRRLLLRLAPLGALVLAAGLVVGSVALGIGGTERSGRTPVTQIPEALFMREPPTAARVAPVNAEEIRLEIFAAPPLRVGNGPASSSPTLTSPGAGSPVAATPRLEVDLVGTSQRVRLKRVVTYEATVKNSGSAPAEKVEFSSHVPWRTTWEKSADCSNVAAALIIVYGGTRAETICRPEEVGSDEPDSHPVVTAFDEPLEPGATVVLRWVVRVDEFATGNVSNHVHVRSGKVGAGSQIITTPIN